MNTIDAKLLKELFLAGAAALDAKKDFVNELNVFPVPDGDTGTNMTMTINSAVKEVEAVSVIDMESICKAISSGSLRGARGNSGVILSQLLRGFTRVVKEYDEIDVNVVAESFGKAVETAYKAVMKPKEGTILTVARAGADAADYILNENLDMVTYFEVVIEHMRYVLNRTPEMLPVLKEAGVVDSGGEGLLIILEGALELLKTKMNKSDSSVKPDLSVIQADGYKKAESTSPKQSSKQNSKQSAKKSATNKQSAPVKKERKTYSKSKADISTADIRFGYCTEFIIMLETEFDERHENEFKIFLEAIGDSIVVVSDDEIVKVHVHTNMPGIAIQKALTYGSLTKMKIDNMREEHEEQLKLAEEKAAGESVADATTKAEKAPAVSDETVTANEAAETPVKDTKPAKPRKPVGFITVSAGEGLSEIFAGLGADIVIEGGQTMNPSTEDMLNAIEQIDADTIFIMPNNSNIILAAEQAKLLEEDKNIIVIPSKTIPQGIMAMLNYMSNKTDEENEAAMKEEMKNVKSGAVTYSIRDTVVQGMEIKQGDIMGIGDSEIMNVGAQVLGTTVELVGKLLEEDSELVTLYYGKDTTEDEANLIADAISKEHPDIDVEVHYGGQPVYYYYLSVE